MVTDPVKVIESAEASDLRNLGAADQARLTEALREGWRLTPATLGHKITNGRWIAARHLLHISTIIATEINRGDARIILTMPARHGKSEFLSVNTPIWFLEKWPGKFVMSISYGSELATDFSLKVRDTLQDEDLHHLLRTRIRQDKKRVDRWLTPNGGGLTAAGIGGPLTGRGADLMLIDDYIKNAEDSLSVGQLKKTWEWFKSTAYTRLEPGASLVILATRWNVNDLIGKCIREMPNENWLVINLPAIAEANDPLDREIGEALWPERFPIDRLLRIKEALGDYWWSAMYQQQPKASMAGQDLGDMIKVISPSEVPDDLHKYKRVRTWDLAATEGGGDFTAGPKMTHYKPTGKFIIEDLQHFQKTPYNTELMISACAEADGHGVEIKMEQEPGSSGVTVIDNYATLLAGYPFKGEKATGPILVRAGPFLAACEAGNIVMVKGDWNQDVVDEVNAFDDNADHDDIVVALALAYNTLAKGLHGGVVWGREGDKRSNVIPILRGRKPIAKPKSGRIITGFTW